MWLSSESLLPLRIPYNVNWIEYNKMSCFKKSFLQTAEGGIKRKKRLWSLFARYLSLTEYSSLWIFYWLVGLSIWPKRAELVSRSDLFRDRFRLLLRFFIQAYALLSISLFFSWIGVFKLTKIAQSILFIGITSLYQVVLVLVFNVDNN